jgi:hypothetical protein
MAITNAPNQGEFAANRAANGYLPLTRGASPVDPPNLSKFGHGDPGGSANLARMASPIASTPNRSDFVGGDPGYTPRPGSAVEPGNGSVPVNPFTPGSNGIVPSSRIPDSAMRGK